MLMVNLAECAASVPIGKNRRACIRDGRDQATFAVPGTVTYLVSPTKIQAISHSKAWIFGKEKIAEKPGKKGKR